MKLFGSVAITILITAVFITVIISITIITATASMAVAVIIITFFAIVSSMIIAPRYHLHTTSLKHDSQLLRRSQPQNPTFWKFWEDELRKRSLKCLGEARACHRFQGHMYWASTKHVQLSTKQVAQRSEPLISRVSSLHLLGDFHKYRKPKNRSEHILTLIIRTPEQGTRPRFLKTPCQAGSSRSNVRKTQFTAASKRGRITSTMHVEDHSPLPPGFPDFDNSLAFNLRVQTVLSSPYIVNVHGHRL